MARGERRTATALASSASARARPRRRVRAPARLNAAEQGQWKESNDRFGGSRALSIAGLSTGRTGDALRPPAAGAKAEGKAASTLRRRFQRWRENGSHLGQLRATLTRNSELWRRWRSELEPRHKREKAELGKEHTAMAREREVLAARQYHYQVAHGVIGVEVSSQVRQEREREQVARERIARWREEHGVQPKRGPERQQEREQRGPERDRDDGPSR